jgi:hypothetical protein
MALFSPTNTYSDFLKNRVLPTNPPPYIQGSVTTPFSKPPFIGTPSEKGISSEQGNILSRPIGSDASELQLDKLSSQFNFQTSYQNYADASNKSIEGRFDVTTDIKRVLNTKKSLISQKDAGNTYYENSNRLLSTVNSNTFKTSIEPVVSNNTNVQPILQLARVGGAIASVGLNSIAPQLGQLGGSALSVITEPKQQYSTLPYDKLTTNIRGIGFIPYLDFRARKDVTSRRLDGASAAIRTSNIAKLYAAESVLETGPYIQFNRDAWFGFGSHGDPNALRKDFTAETEVASRWELSGTGEKSWFRSKNPISRATPFRGDRVSVVDFGQRKREDIYQWKPPLQSEPKKLAKTLGAIGRNTRDFIKFYFTGPKMSNGSDQQDDVFVFRAAITNLYDSFNASWNPVQFIGRADKNYQYGGFERSVNLDFTVYATDRDEMKPIWRKLNYLASYTAPEYSINSLALVAPYIRITIGDLFVHQPMVIQQLTYSLASGDSSWEINIEQDPMMMQAPHRIDVSMGLGVVTDWLPEKGGNMYSLAKQYESSLSTPLPGNDNWLSDSKTIKRQTEQVLLDSSINDSENSVSDFQNDLDIADRIFDSAPTIE